MGHYTSGIKNLSTRLKAEGHKIIRKGKRYFVQDFQAALATLKGGEV